MYTYTYVHMYIRTYVLTYTRAHTPTCRRGPCMLRMQAGPCFAHLHGPYGPNASETLNPSNTELSKRPTYLRYGPKGPYLQVLTYPSVGTVPTVRTIPT